MNIKILGALGEIKLSRQHYQLHSGVLVDHRLLCDIGEIYYKNYYPDGILITHLHTDHAFFMRNPSEYDFGCPVIAPENPQELNTITVSSAPFMLGNYKITPVPTTHSIKVKSQAYLIEKKEKRILYTGDLIDIHADYHPLLKNLDAVITEASFIRKGGLVRKSVSGAKYGHAGIPDLILLFKSFTNHIIFTHFGGWFVKDPVKGKEKIRIITPGAMKLDIGSDGKEFNI
jgi:ribonuclease BN (tRNA processing enzyme)